MKICFPIPGLTYFRYYGPIIELIKDDPNFEIYIYYRRDSPKYNGLKDENNYEIFQRIAKSFNPKKILPMPKTIIKCDVLLSVENADIDKFDFKKHFTIQHGFDYLYLADRGTTNTIYLTNSEEFGKDIKDKFGLQYIVPPIPPAFSNYNKQIDFALKKIECEKEIAFLFFPDKGFISLTKKIVLYLKSKNYFVIIKQRRKCQDVPKKIGADLIVFDDIWYPSEAIFYPLISKVVFGFSCSAFTDLCELGIYYIDNAVLKHYKQDHKKYVKPTEENYYYIDSNFVKNTKKSIDVISSKEINVKNISREKIKNFYLRILKE